MMNVHPILSTAVNNHLELMCIAQTWPVTSKLVILVQVTKTRNLRDVPQTEFSS